MDGPRNEVRMPLLAVARVEGYDTVNHALSVTLPSMQEISLPIRVLYNGPADASRIEQMPLPVMGTWGVVAFPYGLIENAVWLGAFYMSPVNAVTTSDPPTQQDMAIKYMSHPSGAYSILDYFGQYFFRTPDGSNVLINSDNTEPTTYVHTVNEDGTQATQVFYDSARIPTPPDPYYISVNHPSGSSITISPDGTISLVGNTGASSAIIDQNGVITLSVAGPNTGSSVVTHQIVLDPGNSVGNNPLTMTVNSGEQNQAQLQMDQQGDIDVDSSEGNLSMAMTNGTVTIASGNFTEILAGTTLSISAAGGNVTINATGDIILNTGAHADSVNTIINTFNSHVHSGIQTGGSDSGPPTTPLP